MAKNKKNTIKVDSSSYLFNKTVGLAAGRNFAKGDEVDVIEFKYDNGLTPVIFEETQYWVPSENIEFVKGE